MFDRSACAEVRLGVEPHTNLSALVMLGALLRDVRNKRSTAWMPPIRAYHLSLATRIRERSMLRQSRQRSARRRVPQQIDLFATLITRLILDHADKHQMGSTRDGHDL